MMGLAMICGLNLSSKYSFHHSSLVFESLMALFCLSRIAVEMGSFLLDSSRTVLEIFYCIHSKTGFHIPSLCR